jgi:hypothetical protein
MRKRGVGERGPALLGESRGEVNLSDNSLAAGDAATDD